MVRRTAALAAVLAASLAAGAPSTRAGDEPTPGPRVTNLEPGTVLRYPVPILRGEAAVADGTPLRILNASSTRPDRETWTSVRGGRFVGLVGLVRGANDLRISTPGTEARLSLRYVPPTTRHVVRMVYVTDSTGDTAYMAERPDDPQDFEARLDTAAKVLQSFTAERMNDEGWGRRTFALELDEQERVKVRVVRAPHPAAWYHARPDNMLFGDLAPVVEREWPADRARNIAVMGFSRYDPASGRALAHAAVGGGAFALFGGVGLFAWPSRIGDVEERFSDATPVDRTRAYDDSAFRGTRWGVASTTLGAVLHELGHTLDLPHSNDPQDIMTRGFDRLNRAFTLLEPPTARGGNPAPFPADEIATFGRVSSPRLAYHRFLEPDERDWKDFPRPSWKVSADGARVEIEAPHGLRVVGIDAPGESRDTLSWRERAPKSVSLDLAGLRRRAGGAPPFLHLIDDEGNIVHVPTEALVDPALFVRRWRLEEESSPWTDRERFPELPPGGPEALARRLRGREPVSTDGPLLDLVPRYPRRNQDCTARALAVLHSPRAGRVSLLAGSDDAIRVWLNGALVLERLVFRGAAPDQDRVEVNLREGENEVLVEVSNGFGGWRCFLRFEGADGVPLAVGPEGGLRPSAK